MTVTPEMIEAGARAGYESHFAHEWTGGDGVEAELWRQVACNSYAAMKALDPEVIRMQVALGIIEEHRTERPCRTAEEECERTLSEVQAMAREALSQTQSAPAQAATCNRDGETESRWQTGDGTSAAQSQAQEQGK